MYARHWVPTDHTAANRADTAPVLQKTLGKIEKSRCGSSRCLESLTKSNVAEPNLWRKKRIGTGIQ